MHYDSGHPYALRTWLRSHLPWFVINLGIAAKAEDCERVGGRHYWYNIDDKNSGCYHCRDTKSGQLWKKERQA